MGMIVDIVPNHMCISDSRNWRWMDVLENGPSSPQANFFDIDWQPARSDLADKVLIPVLGDQYGRSLENGDLTLQYSDGAFSVRYHTLRFPVAPRTWRMILEPVAEAMRGRHASADAFIRELESIVTALSYLPLRSETSAERIHERQREKEVIKLRLSALVRNSPDVRQALSAQIARMNGTAGSPESFNELERLLAEQAYRLSYWRVAAEEINYRRFFDVDDLAAIRVEDPSVFNAVHEKIFEGIREGWITGLRIDHPDGLYDPVSYFERIRQAVRERSPGSSFYAVAEKILSGGEEPRKDWAIDGTTGYGFMNDVNGLFIDPQAEESFDDLYRRFTRQMVPLPDLKYECKRLILSASMCSELNMLARRLDHICQQHRHSRDFTLESLRLALQEVIACFAVYRTYVSFDQTEVSAEDHSQIAKAIAEAKARNSATNGSIFDAIASSLLLADPSGLSAEQRAERRAFVMRFQQLTGPVMAKAIEDTAFYRYYPLASINEVGGEMETFGIAVKTFHKNIARRAAQWPASLLATSTHDTKRSEDVRARLNTLSEIPEEWRAALERWSERNAGFKVEVDSALVPDRNTEYLLYQTLVGSWPLKGLADPLEHEHFVLRIQEYMEKAIHEAKVHSSWINPNDRYDRAIRKFVSDVLRRSTGNAFLEDIHEFSLSLSSAGLWNSISQTVLKFACPGVPDLYQGCELWSLTLVDPDNRRAVDYAHRQRLLSDLPLEIQQARKAWLEDAVKTLDDGRLKLYVTACLARFRRAYSDFFTRAEYIPLESAGRQHEHIIAFARRHQEMTIVVAVGRFFIRLGSRMTAPIKDVWRSCDVRIAPTLPEGRYRELLSGTVLETVRSDREVTLPGRQLFGDLPVAFLQYTNE
jgi:(1->4)-alpha-D-glucan 1-alpha-D-glucosylmutase